jgi:hypothetical protein
MKRGVSSKGTSAYVIGSKSTPVGTLTDKVIRELLSYENLEDGWDCGVGSSISPYVVERAIKAYKYLQNDYFSYECTPNSDDTIRISFYLKDHFIDVITSKSKYRVVYELGIGNQYETIFDYDNLALTKIKDKLTTIRNQCFSSERLTSLGIVKVREGLMTASPTWAGGSRSSATSVPWHRPKQFVATY